MLTESQAAWIPDESPLLSPITQSYLLVIGIKCYRDPAGLRYIDQLWYKDILQHLRYLKNFTIASPCEYINPPKDAIAIDNDPNLANLQFLDLPASNSFAQALKQLPTTVLKLWQAVGAADIVHTEVAGWPLPFGWLVTPIILLRQKFYLIVVESAPWRLQPGSPSTIPAKIRAHISEKLNRWCVNNTDLAIFTQEEYQNTLLTKRQNDGHIIHASWIDAENIISQTEARELWQKKNAPSTNQLNILLAGRLVKNKGVLVLLEALKILDKENIPVNLDILGQGELFKECQSVSQSLQKVKIQMLGTVDYNTEFFNLLQKYHALVVPTISDEQPRIVYDAYSQAVPLLGNNTDGMRDCIQNGKTGMLIEPNNPVALAKLLKWSWQNLDQLETMGMASLKVATGMVHQKMHYKRWSLLLNKLDDKSA